MEKIILKLAEKDGISDIHISDVSEPTPKEKIYIEPHFSIGVYVDSKLNIEPAISISALHYKDFDFGKFDLSLSEKVKLGIAPVSYNLGSKVPVITDTWISLGVSWNVLDGNPYPGVDLSIGSKF